MAPKTTVLPVGRRRINTHKTWFPATDSNRHDNVQSVASCHWTNGEQLNLAGQEGVEPSSFSLTARRIAFMLPTVKKPPTYGRRLCFKRVEEVRLHADTLTRFDRVGYGKIANCSQMFHIEIGYSQITSYLSTTNLRLTYRLLIMTYWSITKMAVPERIELSHSARQADIMATRSWDPTGASGGDRTH